MIKKGIFWSCVPVQYLLVTGSIMSAEYAGYIEDHETCSVSVLLHNTIPYEKRLTHLLETPNNARHNVVAQALPLYHALFRNSRFSVVANFIFSSLVLSHFLGVFELANMQT